MRTHLGFLCAAATLLVGSIPAQTLLGGDYVVVDYGRNSVHRLTPGGAVSSLHTGSPLTSPTGAAVDHNGDVYVSDYQQGAIYRIPRGGSITRVGGSVATPIRIALDHDRTILIASLTGQALLRMTPTGQVSTIYQGSPLGRVYDVAVDTDGSYLVIDEGINSFPSLYRVTRTGTLSVIWAGAPLRLPHGVALLHNGDYAVIDGLVDAVFRIPAQGGTPTVMTQVPSIINPDSICSDFEGGLALAEELASGTRIDRIDRLGGVQAILNPAPFSNLEAITRAPRLVGPSTSGGGQTATLGLEFAGEAGRPYLVWASATVVPGIALPAPDLRGIATNPDSLMLTSIGANNGVFVQWLGALSANGTAAPQLVLPNIPLPPLRLQLQAATVDFTAPNAIASISNLHPIQL